jgi:hypothetical protein
MDEACSKALQQVHDGTDTENQLRRAGQCLLTVALAWQRLSAPLQTRITLSQYKMLFKCALRVAEREAEKERVVVELPVYKNPPKQSKQRPETPEDTNATQIYTTEETYQQAVHNLVTEIANSHKEIDQPDHTTKNDKREYTEKSSAEAQYIDLIKTTSEEIYKLSEENERIREYNRELTRENVTLKQRIMQLGNSDKHVPGRI